VPGKPDSQIEVCLALTHAISRASDVDEIYAAALDALAQGLGVTRSSILLFDPDGVMRFKASRGLSEPYRRAVEGHSPWAADTSDAQPIVVEDVRDDADLEPFLAAILAERIAAMAFIPLMSPGRVIGKFMLYYEAPHRLSPEELQLASVVAAQVAFAVVRTRAEASARRSEERLRFALDAASMGTWDWDLTTNRVVWSDNLEGVHGLPPGTFDGTFGSYEREIHPDDRERVLAAARRALDEGVPYDIEYRMVAPDGTVRWVEGKGRVEYHERKPIRMTGVCMMVTRRKEAEMARVAALEEAGRLKDEFLATLSHELRTPLNAILGWVQMLQARGVPPERVGHAMDVIGRNATLQARLIEDILDVSRIISGKIAIDRLPLLVPGLIDSAISGVLPAAAGKHIHVDRTVPADLPPIEGDAKRLQQVLGNVLSNAVKFTPEGGEVRVRCGVDRGAIAIEVSDTGVGIEPEFLPFVFDRFRQADSRSTRRHGGLGLGLAIARHLLEQHGGAIDAVSDGPGKGTRVCIRLPVSANRLDFTPTPPTGLHDQRRTSRLRGALTLVVDDQEDSRELLAALLEGWGATVCQADSAAAALSALESTPVRLVIADIAMPDVDGFDLVARVRETHSDIPVVALSAYARAEDRTRALAAGFSGYCAKPVHADELLQVVSDVLVTPDQRGPRQVR
jgi:PAS domain S-box-containing protein